MEVTNMKIHKNFNGKENFFIKEDHVSQLSEIFGKLVWKSTLVSGVHNKCFFNVSTFANGKEFTGTGTTLKMAKNTCAFSALTNYYNDQKGHVISEDIEGRNILPAGIQNIKLNDLKSLQHIKNLQFSNSSLKKTVKSRNFLSQNICHKENHLITADLGHMLKTNLKALDVHKQTVTSNKISTVQMEVCIKSFAKNPIEPQSNVACTEICNYSKTTVTKQYSKSQEEFCNDSLVTNQVSKLKRRREESRSELLEQPQAKRRGSTAKGKRWQENESANTILKNFNPNLNFTAEDGVGAYSMVDDDNVARILNYLDNKSIKKIKNHHTKILPSNDDLVCQPLILPADYANSSLLLHSRTSDIIELKVMKKFNQVTSKHQEVRNYKVLAGIVMTYNMDFADSTVVSIATGTKCVNGGNICCNGTVINDSHAEVLVRRGLMRFLYAKLESFLLMEDSHELSIWERNPSLKVQFRLKPNIHFHLYISTAPCGDGRVYCFNYSGSNNTQYGQLRSKIESRLGTKPVFSNFYEQTWDGLVLGEPLHTMSCSDKIALWNVVGIQGSLLSQLVDPIYLHSIVVGSLFNDKHMYRAICGRFENHLGYLPQPYNLNRPLLGRTSRRLMGRSTNKAPNIGMNWTMGDTDIEIIVMFIGRTDKGTISLLSKLALFKKFYDISTILLNLSHTSNNYAEAKGHAKDFQKCKKEVFEAFCRANLGFWIKKPIEQNEFLIKCY